NVISAARPTVEDAHDLGVSRLLDDVDRLAPLVGAADDDHARPHARSQRVASAFEAAVPRNGSIVATPGCAMPSPRTTCPIVIFRMRRSSRNERLSTYQMSSANFSSQVSALRPCTWLQPVIPGRTWWRRISSFE